jgi:hypothetical protein
LLRAVERHDKGNVGSWVCKEAVLHVGRKEMQLCLQKVGTRLVQGEWRWSSPCKSDMEALPMVDAAASPSLPSLSGSPTPLTGGRSPTLLKGAAMRVGREEMLFCYQKVGTRFVQGEWRWSSPCRSAMEALQIDDAESNPSLGPLPEFKGPYTSLVGDPPPYSRELFCA